jgi:hypothetical protein
VHLAPARAALRVHRRQFQPFADRFGQRVGAPALQAVSISNGRARSGAPLRRAASDSSSITPASS